MSPLAFYTARTCTSTRELAKCAGWINVLKGVMPSFQVNRQLQQQFITSGQYYIVLKGVGRKNMLESITIFKTLRHSNTATCYKRWYIFFYGVWTDARGVSVRKFQLMKIKENDDRLRNPFGVRIRDARMHIYRAHTRRIHFHFHVFRLNDSERRLSK